MPPSVYPAPRTGTAQDLFRIITLRAEHVLSDKKRARVTKSEFSRFLGGNFFRALGVIFSIGLKILPADWVNDLHDFCFRKLSAPLYIPFDADAPQVRRARELAARVARESGREPAIFAVVSHAPVHDVELVNLMLEIERHALLLMRLVAGRPCRPRLLVAIDPFALDTMPSYEEGLYAGFMGTYHVGLDRLSEGRPLSGVWLTPRARWRMIALRFLRILHGGGVAGIVIGGGVPDTARVLYAAREWVREAWNVAGRRRDPAAAARALAQTPAFSKFLEAVATDLEVPRQLLGRAEAWVMCAAAGILPGQDADSAAAGVLDAFLIEGAERERLRENLKEELSYETPSRARFFRALASRAARARGIIFLPIAHRLNPSRVVIGEAQSWTKDGKIVSWRRADKPDESSRGDAAEWGRAFVRENFA